MSRRVRHGAQLAAALIALAGSASAATPDAAERQAADSMRPFYAQALARTGSTLQAGTPAWEASLAASASAFLAARPDDCSPSDWLAATCGARSLIDPSRAMEPSIAVGDTFLTVPATAARPLQRGDVLAFSDPHASDPATATIYVSRLIGMPGDHIRLHKGIILIDGTAVSRLPTGKTVTVEGLGHFTETLPNGRTYDILRPVAPPEPSAIEAVQEDMPEVVVPAGHYFMMGDNRLDAMDSRFAAIGQGPGLPTFGNVIGRVTLIYVSKDPSRIGRRP